MLRWIAWTLALLGILLIGCPAGDDDDDAADDDVADDDVADDDTVGDDDTIGDDDTVGDDDTAADPAITLDETEFFAGEWPNIDATVEGFTIDEDTTLIYDETAMMYVDTLESTATTISMWWAFGLLAEGTYELGLESLTDQVTADIEISPITITDVTEGAAAGSGAAGGDTNFTAFRYEEATGGRFVDFAAVNLGTTFDPYLWVTQSDGLDPRVQSYDHGAEEVYDHVTTWFAEPESVYVRVCASGYENDPAQTFDLDVAAIESLADFEEAELEPNDDGADPQDLTYLIAGTTLTLTGDVTAVGHDGNNIWNEDLDYYAFEVTADAWLAVELDWDNGADDYDLAIYDVSSEAPDFTNYDYLVGGWGAASLAYPERMEVVVRAGTPYVLFVGGWEGNPGDYEVTLALSPEI